MTSVTSEAACLPSLRIPLATYGLNRFTLDWIAGDPNATQFLPRNNEARTLRPDLRDNSLADALIASNQQWGRDVGEDVRRWSRGETFTVIAGQQVGFAGGPIYTLAKLAGMLKLKRDNEARGIPTTVFFWLATEDHDFAEVATLALPKRDAKQQLDLTTFRDRRPAGWPGAVPAPTLVNALAESNRHWNHNVDDDLARWAKGETFTVIA
ncbi:MAG TPA: bacillithiol biosynthesis BshC, partial [Thermoanaerobaculia bacterium]